MMAEKFNPHHRRIYIAKNSHLEPPQATASNSLVTASKHRSSHSVWVTVRVRVGWSVSGATAKPPLIRYIHSSMDICTWYYIPRTRYLVVVVFVFVFVGVFFHPIYYLRHSILSLPVVTQIGGHIAGSSSPLPTINRVRALHFYREKLSALSSLVDSRRIVLTHGRRSQQLIPFLFLQINSKSRHGGIRTHGSTPLAFEGYHESIGATGYMYKYNCSSAFHRKCISDPRTPGARCVRYRCIL